MLTGSPLDSAAQPLPTATTTSQRLSAAISIGAPAYNRGEARCCCARCSSFFDGAARSHLAFQIPAHPIPVSAQVRRCAEIYMRAAREELQTSNSDLVRREIAPTVTRVHALLAGGGRSQRRRSDVSSWDAAAWALRRAFDAVIAAEARATPTAPVADGAHGAGIYLLCSRHALSIEYITYFVS